MSQVGLRWAWAGRMHPAQLTAIHALARPQSQERAGPPESYRTPMLAKHHRQFSPREVVRVLFRHWRRMALFFCVAIGLSLLAIALYPRGYTSESKLFIRVGRESVALDPTATTGQTIMLQKTQLDEVNSALQVLVSREVLQRAVERVGAKRILEDPPASGSVADARGETARWVNTVAEAKSWAGERLKNLLITLRLSDPGTPEEMAVRKLESGIKAYAPKEAMVITLNYSAASPQLAHDVVDAITTVFLDEHVRMNHTEGSLEFFSEQAEKLQDELAAAEAILRDRKNEFQIPSIESRRAVFAKQMEDVELQLLATGREMAYANAEIADLTRAIASLKPELVTNRVGGFANEAKDLMRSKLYELEIEESKLRARYSENHPLLEQIQRQRKEAESILTDVPDDRTQTTAALNPNQRQLELDLLQVQAKKQALQARHEAAQKQRGELNKDLQALNDHEVQIDQLERNVQILDGKYRMHVEKLEQARVNDALGRERISNIKIAQPATLVGKPTSPKKALLLGFGLVSAIGGALTLAFAKEIFDQTLRSTDQVEAELGLPVLLSFPYRKRGRDNTGSGSASAEVNGESIAVNGVMDGRYRLLARELLHYHGSDNIQPRAKTVGIIGCETTKARSRVAAELAIEAANCGTAPVLLIDADERHRRVARRFGLNGSPGWREVVRGAADLKDCVHSANGGRLAVMTPGEEDRQPGKNGHGAKSAPFEDLKKEYGLVVIDMPPASEFEPAPSAGWLDEVVLVVEAERTRIQSAQRAKALIERSGVRVIGVVLANRREHIPRWLYDRI